MTNHNDYITSLKVKTDCVETVTEENYKSLLDWFNFSIIISESDTEIINEEIETMVKKWYSEMDADPKSHTREDFFKMTDRIGEYLSQIKENEEEIEKCKKTIKMIELFVEIKGWG